MRWLPFCINHGAVAPFPPRYCIVVALGGQYGSDRFPWVATLCGDQPRLTSPVYFGARPPSDMPARCARCDELLAEQDKVTIAVTSGDPDAFLEAIQETARRRV